MKYFGRLPKEVKMEDRKITLLRATLDILKKVDESPYVINALETTAIWDDAECDGMCLMEEIEELLSSVGKS